MSQEDDSFIDHPVSYLSRKLIPAKKNYSTLEKEFLSFILALHHFAICLSVLFGQYHDNCIYEPSSTEACEQIYGLTRWSSYLQELTFAVHQVYGKDNAIADWLSRISGACDSILRV